MAKLSIVFIIVVAAIVLIVDSTSKSAKQSNCGHFECRPEQKCCMSFSGTYFCDNRCFAWRLYKFVSMGYPSWVLIQVDKFKKILRGYSKNV